MGEHRADTPGPDRDRSGRPRVATPFGAARTGRASLGSGTLVRRPDEIAPLAPRLAAVPTPQQGAGARRTVALAPRGLVTPRGGIAGAVRTASTNRHRNSRALDRAGIEQRTAGWEGSRPA